MPARGTTSHHILKSDFAASDVWAEMAHPRIEDDRFDHNPDSHYAHGHSRAPDLVQSYNLFFHLIVVLRSSSN
jgi:hypothetical protein